MQTTVQSLWQHNPEISTSPAPWAGSLLSDYPSATRNEKQNPVAE